MKPTSLLQFCLSILSLLPDVEHQDDDGAEGAGAHQGQPRDHDVLARGDDQLEIPAGGVGVGIWDDV